MLRHKRKNIVFKGVNAQVPPYQDKCLCGRTKPVDKPECYACERVHSALLNDAKNKIGLCRILGLIGQVSIQAGHGIQGH